MPRPAPVVINHPLLFLIGTGLWVLALILLGIGQAVGWFEAGDWLWIAGVGAVLGVGGTVYSLLSWRARQ